MPEGAVVVFSAHGVAPQVREEAAQAAACARSTRPARWSPRCTTRPGGSPPRDYDILLIGHEGHEEVVGTTGEAPARIHLVDGPDAGGGVQVRDPAKVAWLSQTTLSVDETNETVAALRERFPQLLDPPSDDICYATQNRQAAVKQIAAESDLVIVVGSRTRPTRCAWSRWRWTPGPPPPTWWTTRRASTQDWLDGRGHRRRDQRCLGPGGSGVRGARPARRARVRRRRGGRGGRGAARLRAAAGAPPVRRRLKPARLRPRDRRPSACRRRRPAGRAGAGSGRAAAPGAGPRYTAAARGSTR